MGRRGTRGSRRRRRPGTGGHRRHHVPLSFIVLVIVATSLQYTRLGKATRAVSDNVDLASATGIDTSKVIRIIWISAGCLAAVGGIFRGLDEQVAWDMGSSSCFRTSGIFKYLENYES